MCRLVYIPCKDCDGDCDCKYFFDEPEYCATVKEAFTKKPAAKPAWTPILSIAKSNIGPCHFIIHGIHYQALEYFKPVDCKHVEYVKHDTEESCRFHSDSEMQVYISQLMLDLRRKENDRKDRAARMGLEERRNPVVQVVKGVLRAILFDEPMR